jgi:uncharacterized protein YbbK (DUF523 family)/uncharacterized protein YbgA (DUF1722 family)
VAGPGTVRSRKPRWRSPRGPIRVGGSACLLGDRVRFDGSHKRDRFLTTTLRPFIEWVPVCPEVELGMGVPRPPVRLIDDGNRLRLVEPGSGRDYTRAMRAWARRRVRELLELDLSGFVLKESSPSCGVARVEVWRADGRRTRSGTGLFAEELRGRLPALPVVEAGRLRDAALRESFVERIFAHRRLSILFVERWTLAELADFHAAHELQLLSHSGSLGRALGRLVAEARGVSRAALRECYRKGFMETLRHRPTPRRHANALRRAAEHLRGRLDDRRRREVLELIESYRRGLVPLDVPVSRIRDCARSLRIGSLAQQVYLDPHPEERKLRVRVRRGYATPRVCSSTKRR